MVRVQVAERGIRDRRVLGAMLDVPRHEFVPRLAMAISPAIHEADVCDLC